MIGRWTASDAFLTCLREDYMAGICDSLVQEHEVIERVLDALEKEARGVDAGSSVDQTFFLTAITFVRQFADGVHHQKEEQVLFPALCEAGMQNDSGPVGVMLFEHTEGRQHIRAMEAALAGAEEGDAAARRQLVHETMGYVNLLRAHIQKENMILFPMAERMLDAEQKEIVRSGFESAEIESQAQTALHRDWVASLGG